MENENTYTVSIVHLMQAKVVNQIWKSAIGIEYIQLSQKPYSY